MAMRAPNGIGTRARARASVTSADKQPWFERAGPIPWSPDLGKLYGTSLCAQLSPEGTRASSNVTPLLQSKGDTFHDDVVYLAALIKSDAAQRLIDVDGKV